MSSVEAVARMAGVSPATVSRVLSNSPHPVRAETRERVLAAAAELDFRPNMLARGLVTARSGIIGTIVHDISDPYFGEIVRGLEDEANLYRQQLLVCSSDRDPERELGYVQSLLSYRVDALIFAGGGIEVPEYQHTLARLLDGFRGRRGAVVLLAPHSYRAPSVTYDNRGGAAAMTRHLIQLGHRTIAFIGGPHHVRTSGVRLRGFRAALEEASILYDPRLVRSGEFTSDGGAKATAELLLDRPDVTAIFAANDVMAFGVLQELSSRGVRIPEDISVAGFDDVQVAAYLHPPLTTVRVPMYEIGRQGTRLALQGLSGEPVRSRRLRCTVVERASTARPGGAP